MKTFISEDGNGPIIPKMHNFFAKHETANETRDGLQFPDIFLDKRLIKKISDLFIIIGMPANIKGYHFLREAVKLLVHNQQLIKSITKQLYPQIAVYFNTRASNVERAMRHAIDVAWNSGKFDNINSLFGVYVYGQNEKPKISEFIALISDKLILESWNA